MKLRNFGVALIGAAAFAAQAATLKATLLVPQDDARLDKSRAERAYLGHPTGPAADAIQVALDEGQFELEAVKADVKLDTQEVADAAGAALLLADLPADALLAVADAVKIPVLNLSAADDRLRAADCRARVFHLGASERQRADALAQTLVSRKWTKLLVLAGSSPADQQRLQVVQAAMKRYGLQAVASKPFKLSGDPRERNLANPLLLTAGSQYDAVWVVDTDGEFARTLPYRTVLPRPVVGDAGLVAVAWHAQFERFGAPQVSKRFTKATKRAMTAHDWTAWLAGKALVAVAVAQPKGPNAAWQQTLGKLQLDGSKGVSMSFRAWDGQLRQPLLLTDGQGVISQAPVEGILHPVNVLDTLGADSGEKLCKATR